MAAVSARIRAPLRRSCRSGALILSCLVEANHVQMILPHAVHL